MYIYINVYRSRHNYRTELGVQKYGKIPYFRTLSVHLQEAALNWLESMTNEKADILPCRPEVNARAAPSAEGSRVCESQSESRYQEGDHGNLVGAIIVLGSKSPSYIFPACSTSREARQNGSFADLSFSGIRAPREEGGSFCRTCPVAHSLMVQKRTLMSSVAHLTSDGFQDLGTSSSSASSLSLSVSRFGKEEEASGRASQPEKVF